MQCFPEGAACGCPQAEESVLQALAADLCAEVRHINIIFAESQLKRILESKLL
jgi:hypothetical protein